MWGGHTLLDEGPGKPKTRALIKLSRGGADATVVREFDLSTLSWVTEDPFIVPEAKTRVCYRNKDLLLIGTDFGEGSLTSSGYPRYVVRLFCFVVYVRLFSL